LVCSYGKSAGAGRVAGSAAVVVELSLWSVTYVRPVEAVVVLGDYMAYSNQRRNADLLSAVCNPGVWMWLLPRWCWWLAGHAIWRVKGFHGGCEQCSVYDERRPLQRGPLSLFG